MENRQRRAHVVVAQVFVKHRQLVRHDQTLVGDHPGRETRHVEGLVFALEGFFRAPPGNVEVALEGLLAHCRRRIDEHLLDVRQRTQRHRAAGRRIHRHVSPSAYLEALFAQILGEPGAGALGAPGILAEENHADGVERGDLERVLAGDARKERVGFLQQQAAAVAGLAIGGDGAPVREALERLHGGANQPVARTIVHLRDQSEAAAVLLEFGRIEPPGWFPRLVHHCLSPLATPVPASCRVFAHRAALSWRPLGGVATEGFGPIGARKWPGARGFPAPAGHASRAGTDVGLGCCGRTTGQYTGAPRGCHEAAAPDHETVPIG